MEECTKCGKPFIVSEHHLAMPGTQEKEAIICPYCDHTVDERMSNGWWNTSKLSDEKIEEYFKKKKQE
jgi:DNA-directed RNA polymerase subunit RPC12/RpoP